MIRTGRITGDDIVRPDDSDVWQRVDSDLSLFVLLNCANPTYRRPMDVRRDDDAVAPARVLGDSAAPDVFTGTSSNPHFDNGRDEPYQNIDDSTTDVAAPIDATDQASIAQAVAESPEERQELKREPSAEWQAAVREAMQKLRSRIQEKPAEQKVGLSAVVGITINATVSCALATIILPVAIVRSIIAYLAGVLFAKVAPGRSDESRIIKLLERLNAHSQSHFSESTLRLALRLGAPFVGMNLAAYWLMNWSHLESLRFPSRNPGESQSSLPFIGNCSEFEYWFFSGNFILLIGIVSFSISCWLEAHADG